MHPDDHIQPSTPDDHDRDHFADWLDAFVTGSLPPGSDRFASESESTVPGGLSAAQSAAYQFHELSIAADQVSTEVNTVQTATAWENILMATRISATESVASQNSNSDPYTHRRHRRNLRTLNAVLSIAAVLTLLIAAASTAWMNRDNLGFGGGDDGQDDVPSQLAAITLPNGDTAYVEYALPGIDDCKATPLSVDQVMEKLSAPLNYEFNNNSRATAVAEIKSSLVPGEVSITGSPVQIDRAALPLTDSDHQQLATAQKEWLACALFGTPFQRWALESGTMVQQEIQAAFFPVIDLAAIRSELDAIKSEGGQSRFSTPLVTDGAFLPMVVDSTIGFYNEKRSDADATLSVIWVRADGLSPTSTGASENERAIPFNRLTVGLPNAFHFIRESNDGPWLLDDLLMLHG